MIKAWTDAAWEDSEYWMRQVRKTLRRILQLLRDIDRNGYEGIGKPERLSGNDARNGENPHEYRLFCPSILLLILD